MRLLELFAGSFSVSQAFAARGWECVGVDLTEPKEIPTGCTLIKADVMGANFLRTSKETEWKLEIYGEHWIQSRNHKHGPFSYQVYGKFDFIWASSPCEEFSVHGMKHFHPNPKYPENGIKLFNHTRQLCEASGLPYVMENVKAAEKFVGRAQAHCGSFYLWGNAVPPLLHRGLSKGFGNMSTEHYHANLKKISPHIRARNVASIPPELANCVADYAERLLEQRKSA